MGKDWPALEVRSRRIDEDGQLEGLVAAVLHDHRPLAIHDQHPPPLPPGGLWDPTAPPPPDPPPTALAWRVCFAGAEDRDAAAVAIAALGLDLDVAPIEMADDDWVARSQRTLTAIEAGRFIVAPPWDVPSTIPQGRTLIVIEPSMGFGTGHHQTTRLCLSAISALDLTGRIVIDLGTGSGVLALAAARRGARQVRALDIDADAIEAAQRSAALNDPAPVSFEVGDVFAHGSSPVDVVLANLTGAMLIKAASPIASLVAPGGRLVISGFVQDERAAVEAALDHAFAVVDHRQEDEWCAMVLRRR